MMKCDDYHLQKFDMLEKRMLDMAKRDEEEKISKSSKAMKLAKKFMGKMEKISDSEDGQKRTIRMIDKFYKLNTSYWESEASEDDDIDSEDDDFEVEKLMMGNARVNEEKTFESEVMVKVGSVMSAISKVDMLEKRMLDMVKRDEEEKISKSSKAMKLAKKFMGKMEKISDSEDGQKRTIRMIDKFYKLNTSYWESEASEDDDTDSEDDDFEVDTSTKMMLGTAKLNKEKTSKSSEVGHKKIIERFNKPNELKASVWDDDFIGKFYREMYSESEASEDELEELFFPGVKAIKNTKMKCDDVIQHSDKFEKLKKRMMGNTSLNEEKASESEGTSSCPEHAIVLRGGTEAPLCASVDKDGKLTKSPRIAFE